jgi:hypothetical protein
MASSSTMTGKEMRALLNSISADPQMKQSKESILLAEDKYPENLDAIFTKFTLPTTLQNTMTLLQWNRNTCCERYEHEIDYRLWDIGSSKSL